MNGAGKRASAPPRDETFNRAHKKWGPALLPGPTAPSEGSAGIRNLVFDPKISRPVFDPGSPAQASLSIAAARESLALPDFASRRMLRLVPLMLRPKTMQLRCSAALLGATALVSALLAAPKCLKPRFTRGDHLFRRLFPAGPRSSPKGLSIACRRRSVLWPPAALSAVAGHLVRLGPPSRSPDDNAPRHESFKAKKRVRSLWITGISGTRVGTLSQ